MLKPNQCETIKSDNRNKDEQTAGATKSLPMAPGGGEASTGFLRQYELVERVLEYQPNADEDSLNRAYVFAMIRHGRQKRHSGDPYFAHPVSVAGILTELRLDQAAIIAGLLHDTVEDTGTSLDEIEEAFGEDVASLVDGVTKIGRLPGKSRLQGDAANFQKFILATARDIRVLLVKLADRLHNMRTLRFMPSKQSQYRVARDTMEIYAPLARRIGLSIMAGELEDLSFRALEPEQYMLISEHLAKLETSHRADISDICAEINQVMAEGGIEGTVTGRVKKPYDIWRKLERKLVALEEIYDIFAFRLIVSDIDDCYRAFGLAHRRWAALPGGVKDYISVPKPNGYHSLHTRLRRPGGRRIELQIRTARMHDIAEHGVAAHWRYKNAEYVFDRDAARADGLDVETELTALADMLAHGAEPEEFLEHAKLELYRDSVFVFTPKGRLIKLPAGAMPLDFAYALHTDIGDVCSGAAINGAAQPLRTVLQNGDVVEIYRSDKAAPLPDWECLVVTGRARSAIRRMIRGRKRREDLLLGSTLLKQESRLAGISDNELDFAALAEANGYEASDDLLADIGDGRLAARSALAAVFPDIGERKQGNQVPVRPMLDDDSVPALVAGVDLTPGVSLKLAECCHPLPGDKIIGLLQRSEDGGQGSVQVHVADCRELEKLEAIDRSWVNLRWRKNDDEILAVTRLVVTTINARGVLAKLCQVVSDTGGNISNVEMTVRTREFFEMQFDIEVKDTRHSTRILAALRTLKPVVAAARAQG